MATKLESKVVRETSVQANDREIIICLKDEDQSISMKLKGMKSGIVNIGIKELWDQLNAGGQVAAIKKHVPNKKDNGNEPMISLNRLRSMNATTPAKAALVARMDELILELIDDVKIKEAEHSPEFGAALLAKQLTFS